MNGPNQDHPWFCADDNTDLQKVVTGAIVSQGNFITVKKFGGLYHNKSKGYFLYPNFQTPQNVEIR